MSFVDVTTYPEGVTISVNAKLVATLEQEKVVDKDAQPNPTTTLTFVGGVRKRTVEGSRVQLARELGKFT